MREEENQSLQNALRLISTDPSSHADQTHSHGSAQADAYERFCQSSFEHYGSTDTIMFIFSLNRSSQPDPSLLHFQEAQHPAATPMFSQSPAPCPAQLSLSSRQMNGAVCLSVLPCPRKALLQEAPSSTPACPARSAFGSLDWKPAA